MNWFKGRINAIAHAQKLIRDAKASQAYMDQYSIDKPLATSLLDGCLFGDSFRDCMGCPEMVVLPTGTFQMVGLAGDNDEQPPRRVSIERPIAVGKYEVTFTI